MKMKIICIAIIGMFLLMVSSAAAEEHVEVKYEQAIEKGVSYLVLTQSDAYGKKGEFAFYEFSKRDASEKTYKKCMFGSPLVYHSLSFLKNLELNSSTLSKVEILRTDAVDFIKMQREIDEYDDPKIIGEDIGGSVWRYYYGSDILKDRQGRVLPVTVADIDCTVLALQALYASGEDVNSYFPYNATDYFVKYQLRDSYLTHKGYNETSEEDAQSLLKTISKIDTKTPKNILAKPFGKLLKIILMLRLMRLQVTSVFLSFLRVPDATLRFNSFSTWIDEEDENHNLEQEVYDSVVNCNVLFFYSTQLNSSELQEKIPGVFDYLNYVSCKMNEYREITIFPMPWTGPDVLTKIYMSPFSFTYFLTRAYKDGGAPISGEHCINIDNVKNYLFADDDKDGQLDRQKEDGSWGNFRKFSFKLVTNDLETAYAAISMLNIYDTLTVSEKEIAKKSIEKSIEYLLENQNSDGSWDGSFFCTAVPPALFSCSEELTTGFVLEALAKYQYI